MRNLNVKIPRQKLSVTAKNKTWLKQNLDALDTSGYFYDSTVRLSLAEKQLNLDLYNGIIHMYDVKYCINPTGLEEAEAFLPKRVNNYSLITPRIDLLVGEESKRRFDWKVIVTNDSAISEKEKDKQAEMRARLLGILENTEQTDEQFVREVERLEEWATYEYQDIRELTANRILKHYWLEHKMDRIFLEGFRDALVQGEEIYQVYLDHNEPVLRKLNPLNVHVLRSGRSNNIADADMIVIDEYWSPGAIIDRWHEELKSSEIDIIEKYSFGAGDNNRDDVYVNNQEPLPMFGDILNLSDPLLEGGLEMLRGLGTSFGLPMDNEGNIRVLHVYWKSYKKVKKVTSFDPITGEPVTDIHAEVYVVDELMGETSKDIWIAEWWEGVKIADKIYVQMRPCEHQFRRLSNPSKCHPGIIGKIYNLNEQKSFPLVSRMKSLQYLYNIIYDRLNESLAKNAGRILELDISMVPDGWSFQDVMTMAKKAGILVKDSSKIVNEGPAKGTLAGNLGHSGHSIIDAETGQYIQQHLGLLEYIRKQIGEISGISEQRLGNISNRETVGGVERSVMQSSHNTEYWFFLHEECKIDALNVFLDAAKIALRNNPKKRQYILEDYTTDIFNLEDLSFSDVDFGVFLTTHPKAQEIDQLFKQNAMMALQANLITFTEVMDIYMSNSLSETRRKIEKAEKRRQEQQLKQQEQMQAMEQAKVEADIAEKDAERELKIDLAIIQADTQLKVAQIGADSRDPQKQIQSQEKLAQNDLTFEKLKLDKTLQTQERMAKIKARSKPATK